MTDSLKSNCRAISLVLMVFLVGFFSVPALSGTSESYSLNGQWKFATGDLHAIDGYRDDTTISHWQTIKVPANWYNEGVDYSGSAWYRRNLPRRVVRAFGAIDDNNEAIAYLRFSGVDYAADVWLNEQHAGHHEGYFSPFEIDVSDVLASGSTNKLVVRVDSPEEHSGPSWGLHKRLIKGVLSHHDTRPGGAWSHRGQEKNTGGIWEGVSVELASGAYLGGVDIAPKLEFLSSGALKSAAIRVRASVQRFRGIRKAKLVLRVFDPDSSKLLMQRDLGSVTRRKPAIDESVVIEEPKLWWPWGRGMQPIYRAEVVAVDDNGKQLHAREFRFGLRSVSRSEDSGAWTVNGKRLFLKGTNYIATQWKSNFTKEDYLRDLTLMKAANINAVRVHAQVESSRFYEAADELGMLIWQDFPLQWGYEDSQRLLKSAKRQLIEMMEFLGEHPSIVAWSIHNEPPWDADWMKWKYLDYDPSQNKQLDDALYELALKRDRTRYVHKVSRTQEHQWFGWYAGTIDTFAKADSETLVSEFGAQALPVLSSLEKIISPENLWPTTDQAWAEWDYKNFQKKETFELAKVAQPENTDEFISLTQNYQRELITFAGAAYRSRQYAPLGAMFQFMFVEDWPSINWGVVDWFRIPKPGYKALQAVYSSVLAVPVLPGQTLTGRSQTIPIVLVSDLWADTPSVQITVGLFDESGDPVEGSQKQFVAHAKADSANRVAQWRMAIDPGSYRLKVTTDSTNRPSVTVDLGVAVISGDQSE